MNILKNRYFWGVVVAVLAVIILNYVRFNTGSDQTGNGQASLIIFFDRDHQRMFEGDVKEGMSVLQVLEASSKAGNFALRYSIENSGEVNLYSIDGKVNEIGGKWLFFLNGKRLDTESINHQSVGKNDKIEARYE